MSPPLCSAPQCQTTVGCVCGAARSYNLTYDRPPKVEPHLVLVTFVINGFAHQGQYWPQVPRSGDRMFISQEQAIVVRRVYWYMSTAGQCCADVHCVNDQPLELVGKVITPEAWKKREEPE